MTIHEHTRVRSIDPAPAAPGATSPGALTRLRTGAGGTLDAARVVLAAGAWAASLPEFSRRMFVVASDVIATRRAPERLDAIGWRTVPRSATRRCASSTTSAAPTAASSSAAAAAPSR